MIRIDKGALLCDFAETYHIYDIRSLPARLAATYAVGLRDNSRIKMKITGTKAPEDILLLAMAVDRLTLLLWAKTKDGQRGRNKPESITEKLLGADTGKKREFAKFDSPEDFEAYRRKLLSE